MHIKYLVILFFFFQITLYDFSLSFCTIHYLIDFFIL
jgi:hypothetical protein